MSHETKTVKATGTCSSVMPPQPWRSFRYPRPSNVTWLRLSRVSRTRSSNNVLFVAISGILPYERNSCRCRIWPNMKSITQTADRRPRGAACVSACVHWLHSGGLSE
jgi:hypothetical protein